MFPHNYDNEKTSYEQPYLLLLEVERQRIQADRSLQTRNPLQHFGVRLSVITTILSKNLLRQKQNSAQIETEI